MDAAADGSAVIASVHSALASFDGIEEVADRVRRARDALDRGVPLDRVPLERATSARGARGDDGGRAFASPSRPAALARMQSAPSRRPRAPAPPAGAADFDVSRPIRSKTDLAQLSLSFAIAASPQGDPRHRAKQAPDDDAAGAADGAGPAEAGERSSGSFESRVFSWGRENLFHDEDETQGDGPAPVARFARTRIVAVATGGFHALAVDDEGAVYAAGSNDDAQCDAGRGAHVGRAVRVEGLPVGARIIAVAAGGAHSAAVTATGKVLCWGSNDRGQLGLAAADLAASAAKAGGGASAAAAAALALRLPRAVGGVLARCVVAQVACGDAFTVARTARLEVYAWGAREACCNPVAAGASAGAVELPASAAADSTAVRRIDGLAGVPVVDVCAGAAHAIALSSAGGCFAWGRNNHAQCGLASDVEVVWAPRRVCGLPHVANVAAGRAHSLFTERSGAGVWACGRNHAGQLGLDAGEDVAAPRRLPPAIEDLWRGTRVVEVACGDAHSLLALASGAVVAVGSDRARACFGSRADQGAPTTTTRTLRHVVVLDARPEARLVVAALAAAGDASVVIADYGAADAAALGSPTRGVGYARAGASSPSWHFVKHGRRLARESSIALAKCARPITPDEAAGCGAAAAAGDAAALDRIADVVSWPSLLAASFVREADAAADARAVDDVDEAEDARFDARAFDRCFAPLDDACRRSDERSDGIRRKLALAVVAGASRLSAQCDEAATADAARAALALLAVAAAVAVDEYDAPDGDVSTTDANAPLSPAKALRSPARKSRGSTSYAAWDASRAAVELLLAMHTDGRRRLVAALLPRPRPPAPAEEEPPRDAQNPNPNATPPRGGVRRAVLDARAAGDDDDDALRRALLRRVVRPLRFLVVAAVRRSALDGVLPSGDGVLLAASSALLRQLEAQPGEQSMGGARDVVLDAPAHLAAAALRAHAAGALPRAHAAFSAARRGCVAMELLRRASTDSGVPRREVLDLYKVSAVDALGVVIATPAGDGSPRGYGAGPGSILVDFLRWRDAGSPRALATLDEAAWFLSTFSFLLAAATKRELLAVDARRRQGEAGARAALMAPWLPREAARYGAASALPYLVLRVPRQHLLAAALATLAAAPDSELTKELKVIFEGEAGVDEGGVRKEFFQLLVPQLFDPVVGMFVQTSNADDAIFFNGACDWYEMEFELAGLLVGLAAYNSVVLDIRLPRVAYAKLLDYAARAEDRAFPPRRGGDGAMALGLDDLAELDAGLARGLRQLLVFEPAAAVEGTFCRAFVDDDPARAGGTVDLVPGGADLAVTGANREAYVAALVEWRLGRSVAPQFTRFAKGFWRVMQGSALRDVVEPEELQSMVQGEAKLDFAALRRVTVYEGWADDDCALLSDFWRIVEAYDTESKRRFLMFVTGSKTGPMGGLGALRPPAHPAFRIQRAGPDSEHLPTSHTCFNTLLLPEYDPPEKLAARLHLAFHECEGFGLQ